MKDEQRNANIRALSRKIIGCLHGKNTDVAGAALATVLGTFLLDLSQNQEQAISGLEAISTDAAHFILMAHVHEGTRQ